MSDCLPHPASYRDPSGFVFRSEGLWYRQVNTRYTEDYRYLMDSGLYELLTRKQLLISHAEVDRNLTGSADYYRTLLPQQLSFISYPTEWSPAQLKEAALLTLTILSLSIDKGMILKDATPLNVQFRGGKALFIDSLSFERYDPSRSWIAYRQFCECFLFPLYLHHYHRQGVHKTLIAYPEGIPARTTLSLLPLRSRLRLGVWLHVFLPARIRRDRRNADDAGKPPAFDQKKMHLLADNLKSILQRLGDESRNPTEWSDYYRETILSPAYLQEKEKLFREMIGGIGFASALDLGANDGHFSKILAEKKAVVIAADSDWACVEALFRWTRQGGGAPQAEGTIYPLVVDIADPTPASGWFHAERSSFTQRVQSDLVTALALVHHLVLGRNIPLPMIAGYFAALTRSYLIIEFVPSSDEKALEITRNKPVGHTPYDPSWFEHQFGRYFTIERRSVIPGTERILYLMKKNEASP